MSDFDPFNDPDHESPEKLLDELESIKGVLDDDAAPGDIPLLDDMVIGNLDINTKLLNLNQIFEEEVDTDNAPVPAKPARMDVQFPRFSLDTMLTETAPGITEPAAPTIPSAPTTAAPPIHKPAPATKRIRPDYSREVLIQELVDEFIPQIEAALRERLSQLDNTALQHWKDHK